MTNGVILYHGPSELTGDPIVAVATGLENPSDNTKTGDLYQVHIFPEAEPGHLAVRSGLDRAVCGDCTRRPLLAKRSGVAPCYVKTWRAPSHVWKAWRAGQYASEWRPSMFARTGLRMGAWGDPAAVPIGVWVHACSAAGEWTGYTHQWRSCNPLLKLFAMASCDTVADAREAAARGWRWFLAGSEEQLAELDLPSFHCPASAERNHLLSCADCMACDGTRWSEKLNPTGVTIVNH